ncbi:MAG: class I SAM-dependent methyltransferase [Flavobacteriales bacterium]|nr:class I SAM-dependent methyltransferase [Flavobacteriales bacterium]
MSGRSFHVELSALTHVLRCPICGSDTLIPWGLVRDHLVSHGDFQLVDCSQCGFRMTSPRPPVEQIGVFYASDAYISHSNSKRGFGDHIYQVARKLAFRSKYRLIRRHVPTGKLLDIGCGTGQFLHYLSGRGYLVQGVEPDQGARERAIADLSLSVLPSIQDVPAREQFQVITMWHVLEHVHDLPSMLKWLYAALAPGGFLFLAIPDRGSWDAEYFRTLWAAYDVPRHLWHFRSTDVTRLCAPFGLSTFSVRSMWLDAPYISLLSSQHSGHGPIRSWIDAIWFGLISNLFALLTSRPTSSSLVVLNKPKACKG